jgi:DegV family protein with EDD domain
VSVPGIVCDSTAYLSDEQVRDSGINVVSLWVNDGGRTERELDMDFGAFYRRLADTRALPTSSQPSPEEMTDAFKRALEQGDGEALGVFISSDMSGTFESARLAVDLVLAEQPEARIELVDSRSNCMQLGYSALAAAKAAAEGKGLAECAEAARECRRRTRFLFSPHSLEYLERGGRVGRASALLGGMLQIMPVLTVEDGVTSIAAKVRTRKKALAEMASRFAADVEAHGLRNVTVHSIVDVEAGRAFAREYIEPVAKREVSVTPIGPVIGLHVGPAVAVAYETEGFLRPAV